MKELHELENKIRQSIPELKEEYEAFEDSSIDRYMITPVMLNHVLEYLQTKFCNLVCVDSDGELFVIHRENNISIDCVKPWNLKSPYLKDQNEELINFLNEL